MRPLHSTRCSSRARLVLAALLLLATTATLPACGDPSATDASVPLDAALDDLRLAPDLSPPPRCDDGEKNGAESDIDCGGPTCLRCDNQRRCASLFDCKSGLCTANRCAGPSCNDRILNGSETGVDCGGTCGTGCRAGEGCKKNDDCKDGLCDAGTCAPPGCGDGRKNGSETDIDCGGGACVPCAVTRGCASDGDCASSQCDANAGRCVSCGDGQKDGSESDVDCGGLRCAACALGRACTADRDCASHLCAGNACAACQQDADCPYKVCNAGVCNALELVGSLNGQDFFKVSVMGAMTDTNVFAACMAAGMRTPCQSMGKCQYNDNQCAPTMESNCGGPMQSLAKVLCNTTPPTCKALDGVYQYMGHGWVQDSACGADGGLWCVQGAGKMNRWALCVQ